MKFGYLAELRKVFVHFGWRIEVHQKSCLRVSPLTPAQYVKKVGYHHIHIWGPDGREYRQASLDAAADFLAQEWHSPLVDEALKKASVAAERRVAARLAVEEEEREDAYYRGKDT
jgi:hypothetical protein